MRDPRIRKVADVLVHHSTRLQAGEKVLIEAIDAPEPVVLALVEAATDAGAHPVVLLKNYRIFRHLLQRASVEALELTAAAETRLMDGVDAYIAVRGSDNISELADVPTDRLRLYEQHVWKPVHLERRLPSTKWVLLRWPTPGMAQLARQSTESFEDYFFDVCTLDYGKMSRAMQPLKERMEATNRVRLVAPGTDLSFSIEGIPAVACDGRRNIPDGEVYTAPVRDSAEGVITYNTPSLYRGVIHENVRFRFEAGKIVEASSTHTGHLEEVLDTDGGARYIGEFAIGFNPYITRPIQDGLFDEKIAGSIHLTPGNAYDTAFNGNRSQIHWDLVLQMDAERGGGEIWFDDTLVRKDGLFVVEDLVGLNPENLL